MSPQKQKASVRLNSQIMKMKQFLVKNQICNTEIAKLSGITAPNVWRFINRKSPEPSALTFLMIAEAIGYEISITMPEQKKSNLQYRNC